METISMHEAGLMAAWRATGGAGGAMRGTAAQDDGMAAFGISRSVLYCGDDGLTATQYTDPYRCGIDEGLEAGGRYTSYGCLLNDDGLKAAAHTSGFRCLEDDRLKAGAAPTIGAFCW